MECLHLKGKDAIQVQMCKPMCRHSSRCNDCHTANCLDESPFHPVQVRILNESSSQVIVPAFVPFILVLDFGKGMEGPAPPEPPAASAMIRAALVYIILPVVNNTDIVCLRARVIN